MKPIVGCAAYAIASLGLHAWLLSANPSTASERRRVELPPLLMQLSELAPPKVEPSPPAPQVEPTPPRVPLPVAKPAPVPEPPPSESA